MQVVVIACGLCSLCVRAYSDHVALPFSARPVVVLDQLLCCWLEDGCRCCVCAGVVGPQHVVGKSASSPVQCRPGFFDDWWYNICLCNIC
jgi:hypothetical protein